MAVQKESSQEIHCFQTRCHIQGKLCSLIIDGNNCYNYASTRLVSKLNLDILESNQVEISFSVGKYVDTVLCNVMPMETCHLLLGKPWHQVKRPEHDGVTNKLYFYHGGRLRTLVPLSPSKAYEDQKQLKEKIEKERKENELREQEERKKELEKEKESNELCNSNVFSSSIGVQIMQESEDKIPCIWREHIGIIPSAPLYIQPSFGIPIGEVMHMELVKPFVSSNTFGRQTKEKMEDKHVRSYVLSCSDVLSKIHGILMERNNQRNAKDCFVKVVFDPGGFGLHTISL